ncbi:MFS transporter, DHA2 family, multidrug resistance protein [Bryocella elongata]|uniref:MFS transporter, DHA2 family, multidrug resistance protein n=1 Tax=Bryocella elongata TaxID=863522 RepID=A0A1H5YA36_9BACT|nr:DHA2 family efflux MFS transporter permease subunit [Bryocella elongata]SEG20635.1 MFS transporter, DHA2 family, multidrug resistance protein [Bryocella elongata]
MAAATATEVSTTVAAPPWRPRINPWIVAMTVTLATFMEVLDSSIANVALPHIAGGLGATQDEATWVLTAYLVANAIILPAGAYMTTFIGRKKFYMICVALFGISSALCGLAVSLPMLVFFRILQGIGGGGLAPSEQAILADTFPPEKRGQAFAMYGLAVVVAPAIGPTLGGYITDNFDWRWIFYLNVPICLLSLFLTSRIVEDPPWVEKQVKESQKGGIRLDLIGFGLLAITFGALEFVLDKGQEDDWFGSKIITFFIAAMVIAFITMIWWELKQLRDGHRPILNLTLFKRRQFAISFMLMFVLGFSLYGTTILIPQFVQTLLGYTAELAGLVLSPAGFMMMAMMPVVGVLSGKIDPRKLIGYGFFMLTVSLMYMAQINLGISYGELVLMRIFQASGLAFLFIPINTIAYIGVKQNENNDVSGLTNLARNIGGSSGTAFMATMLTRRTAAHENSMIRNLTPSSPGYQQQVSKMAGSFKIGNGTGVKGGPFNGASFGAIHQAQAYIYNEMHRQAATLAYVDIIRYLTIFCACMIPLLFFIPKPPKNASASAGH